MSLRKFFLVVLTFIVSFTLTTLPALAFDGQMDVTVCNSSNTGINVQVVHHWQSSLDNVFPVSTGGTFVDKDQCSPGKPINVGSGGTDSWGVTGAYVGGGLFSRENKQCNVEEDDLNSGTPIQFIIFSHEQGFSIKMPKSSSCLHNHF